jgi:hypothetical protein
MPTLPVTLGRRQARIWIAREIRVRRVVTPDGLGGWPVPTDEQVRRLSDLVAHPARLRYFFSRLENPLWLERLARDGWYAPERVPEPIVEADGTARIDFWPLSDYLRRVGGDVPGTAASVVRRLVGTANPIVQRDLVATLLRLPADSAEGFIDDVIDWIHGPRSRLLDERDLGDLAIRLLDDGRVDAGQRLASAILSRLQEEYWLREAVGAFTDPLARSGIDGVLVFADALDRVVADQSSAEAANFMRASIADHEQDQHVDAADHLINGLRDCALAYLLSTGDPGVLQTLLRRTAVLSRRIVYYVAAAAVSALSGDEDLAANSDAAVLIAYARSMALDKAAFDDPRTRLEYGALVRALLPHLAAQDIELVAEWLRQGPPMSNDEIRQMLGSAGAPAPAEEVARFRDHWRADRMALLGEDLPEPLAAIAAELVAEGVEPPEHPGFSHWTSVGGLTESPVSQQELSSMTVGEVIELARNYRPPNQWPFRFSDQPLTQQISSDIIARPGEYSLLASGFADMRQPYLTAILEGLRQAVGAPREDVAANDPENPLGMYWEPILSLLAGIADEQDPGGRNAEQPDDSPRWTHRCVLTLLKTALTARRAGLSAEHAEVILAVIRRLLDSPDPVPEDETAEDRLNPADRALNSVRGQAAGCMVAFSSWWRGLGKSEDDAPPVLLELLSRELDLTRETSTAVRTVYGQFFPLLHSSLPIWTAEHLEAIFGPPATPESAAAEANQPRQTLAGPLGQAAFDAYLLTNGSPDRSYPALLKPYYEREISRLREQPPRAWRSALRNTRQALLDHLLLLLLWNALSTDDSLITRAIRRAGAQDAGEAVGHLGWLIFRTGEAALDQAQAGQNIWTWWREQAQKRSASGNRDSAVAMVAGFPWWWRAANLDTTWQFKELLLVLDISPSIETPSLVVQTLADRVSGNEANVVTALEIILDNTTDYHQLQNAVMKAQPALRQLLGATDSEIRRRTTVLVEKIAAWGLVELARQII